MFAGPQGCIKSESCVILKLMFCVGIPFMQKPQSPNFEIMNKPTTPLVCLLRSLSLAVKEKNIKHPENQTSIFG